MKNVINMNSQRKQVITLDYTAKANELNDFFYRFERLDFSKQGAEALETVHTSSSKHLKNENCATKNLKGQIACLLLC